MARPGLKAKVLFLLVLVAGWLVGAPGAWAADLFSVGQLATIGLSDFSALKVLELCIDYDRLTRSGEVPEFTIEVELDRAEIPDLGLRATRGRWAAGPIRFEKEFGEPLCISNLDVKIDLAKEGGEIIDSSGLEAKLEQLEEAFSGDTEFVELEKPEIDEDEGRDAREIIDSIRANNGLLPAFTIQFTYRVKHGSHELESKTVTLVNTNPRPIRVLRPIGPALRPALRFEIPSVPMSVAYLENEFWIEDADGNNVWQGYVPGGAMKVRYSPADYGRTVSHAYPSAAPDLVPGRSYVIVSKLRDPYGVEIDPSRLVGVRHDPDGETATYEVAVEPVELVSPTVGDELEPAGLTFEWRDPNSAEIRRSVSRYQLNVSGQPPVSVTGTRYTLRTPLLPNSEYTWYVEAIDRFGEVIPGSRSETASFRTLALPGRAVQPGVPGGEEEFEDVLNDEEMASSTLEQETEGAGESGPVVTEQAPRAAGFVAQVFSGGSLLVGDREFPAGTGLLLTGRVPEPYILVGERIVATGLLPGAAVAQIRYIPLGASATQEITLRPGTYIAGPQCLMTEDGRCL